MATIFFIIIAFFVICHTGKFVVNFYEILSILTGSKDDGFPSWAQVLTNLSHFSLVLNSSVNFFIYCFRDIRFRQVGVRSMTFSSIIIQDWVGRKLYRKDWEIMANNQAFFLLSQGCSLLVHHEETQQPRWQPTYIAM